MNLDDWMLIKGLAQTDVVERFVTLRQQWFVASQHYPTAPFTKAYRLFSRPSSSAHTTS